MSISKSCTTVADPSCACNAEQLLDVYAELRAIARAQELAWDAAQLR